MGAFLDKPKTDKFQECGEGNGLRYGVASMQGWRVEMEDAHMAKTNLGGALKDWSYFAVFDGHAGAKVTHTTTWGIHTKIQLKLHQFMRFVPIFTFQQVTTSPDIFFCKLRNYSYFNYVQKCKTFLCFMLNKKVIF